MTKHIQLTEGIWLGVSKSPPTGEIRVVVHWELKGQRYGFVAPGEQFFDKLRELQAEARRLLESPEEGSA